MSKVIKFNYMQISWIKLGEIWNWVICFYMCMKILFFFLVCDNATWIFRNFRASKKMSKILSKKQWHRNRKALFAYFNRKKWPCWIEEKVLAFISCLYWRVCQYVSALECLILQAIILVEKISFIHIEHTRYIMTKSSVWQIHTCDGRSWWSMIYLPNSRKLHLQ